MKGALHALASLCPPVASLGAKPSSLSRLQSLATCDRLLMSSTCLSNFCAWPRTRGGTVVLLPHPVGPCTTDCLALVTISRISASFSPVLVLEALVSSDSSSMYSKHSLDCGSDTGEGSIDDIWSTMMGQQREQDWKSNLQVLDPRWSHSLAITLTGTSDGAACAEVNMSCKKA